MKKIVLSTLLLTSILCGSNKNCDLDQVIINSDLDTLQAISPKAQRNTNEYTRIADLAQQIINKRQSDLKLFRLGNYRGYEPPEDKSNSTSIVEMTCVSSFSVFIVSVISLPILTLYNEWRNTLYSSLHDKVFHSIISTTMLSAFIFYISLMGTLAESSAKRKRKEDKIFNELNQRYDNAIQIKNLLLKQLSNKENQKISPQR